MPISLRRARFVSRFFLYVASVILNYVALVWPLEPDHSVTYGSADSRVDDDPLFADYE